MSKWGLLKVVYDNQNKEIRAQSDGMSKAEAVKEAATYLRSHATEGHAVKVVMFEMYE